jgi:hypothetical protein
VWHRYDRRGHGHGVVDVTGNGLDDLDVELAYPERRHSRRQRPLAQLSLDDHLGIEAIEPLDTEAVDHQLHGPFKMVGDIGILHVAAE